jgi:hypothetical protein
MANQQFEEQKRLSEILKLARMQLNDEYMKQHASLHTAWITNARTAWTTNGTLLPFTTKFVYPTEEEVVARGVEIYNTLTAKNKPAPVQITEHPVEVIPVVVNEPTPELLQAGGDIVIAETTDAPVVDVAPIEEPVNDEPVLEDKFKSLFTKWGGRGNY